MPGNIRTLLLYIIACYSAGVMGAFFTAFMELRNEKLYIKDIWKTLIGAGAYSLALSKLFQLVLVAFVPRLMVEPPYPLGFLIGMFVSYITVKPNEDKDRRVLNVINAILGKFGLKVDKKDDD